ncbi:MFS transporter [Bacillus sp. V3-13]|uniref:MFS transporter n=1 Tax=Bacillus sp. V3-13 TaxID=2053728 RepID=UPI0035B50DF2
MNLLVSNSCLKWTSVILTISGIFVASNIYTLIPIYAFVASSLEVGEKEVVAAGSLFTLFYGFGLLCFGPISDKFGRKKVIVLGLLASAFTSVTVGFSESLALLYISRSLQGFTLGSFAPVAFAYSFDLFPAKQRTMLIVLINTGFLAAGILGQLLSSAIALQFSWVFVYYFFAICYLMLFFLTLWILPKSRLPETSSGTLMHSFTRLLKNRSLLKCYGITFTLLFSFIAFYDALGRAFAGSFHELLVLRAVGLIGACLSLFTGQLVGRFGTSAVMKAGALTGAFSAILMLFYQGPLFIALFSILLVSAISLLIPTVITVIGQLGGTDRGKALSLYSFVLLLGATIAPPLSVFMEFHMVLLIVLLFFAFNTFFGHSLAKEML